MKTNLLLLVTVMLALLAGISIAAFYSPTETEACAHCHEQTAINQSSCQHCQYMPPSAEMKRVTAQILRDDAIEKVRCTALTEELAQRAYRQIAEFAQHRGPSLTSVQDDMPETMSQFVDGWNQPFLVRVVDAGQHRMQLVSAGHDEVQDTEDDLTFSFGDAE